MRLWTRFIIVGIISVGLAWLLSYLPDIQSDLNESEQELQVFNHEHSVTLSDGNLVDWVVTIPLQMKLRKVDWSDRILSVDFEAGTPLESTQVIYNQLLDFVYYGLGATNNVDRVWVRLLQTPTGGADQTRRLLLALDANREQISEEDYEQWKSQLVSAEYLIKRRFQLTLTPLWSKIHEE